MREERTSRHSAAYQKNKELKTSKSTKFNRKTKERQGKSVDPIKSTQIPHLEEKQKVSVANLISQTQQMELPILQNIQSPCYNTHLSTNNDRLAFSLSSSRSEKIEPILPAQLKQFLNKKTLILDLDETLVHSGFKPFDPSDLILTIELEKQMHNIHVLVRPGVEQFLTRMSKRFEIIVFTASLSKYADPLLNILDKDKVCQYRLFRENCTMVNGAFIKDLKRLGRNMKNVILVDNSPVAYGLHPENGFPIKSWYDDKNDRELFNLAPLIEFLSYVPDVRAYIPKMVVNNEISFQLAMDLIKNYNIQLKSQQMQMQQYNKIINTNDDNNSKGINIKIVNNNFTNYIYNNNYNNNKNISNHSNDNNIEEVKPNNKRNKNRNSCSGTNLHITSNSSSSQLKRNVTQNNHHFQSCRSSHSLKKDSKKKNMIRLTTAKDNATNTTHNKSNIPIPFHKKNNMKRINITTNGSKRKGDSIKLTNTTTNGCIDYNNNNCYSNSNQINLQIHKRQRSFNQAKSQSKSQSNIIAKSSAKHSRSNSSNQSKVIGFKHETFTSVDKIAFPYDSYNRNINKSNQKSLKRTKSTDKLTQIPCNYSTHVSTFRPSTCKFKNIDIKKQYDSDMIPLSAQDLLYY